MRHRAQGKGRGYRHRSAQVRDALPVPRAAVAVADPFAWKAPSASPKAYRTERRTVHDDVIGQSAKDFARRDVPPAPPEVAHRRRLTEFSFATM